ncbi:MAG: RidA family protein [Clostridia bacterium]|nr:RidA family protein [Clostridia bacterium]
MENKYVYITDQKSNIYSDIVEVGDVMYLAGLVSEDLSTRDELYGDITFETKTVLDNLKVILENNGSDMNHIVKIDVILKNWADKAAMNAEYVKHFDKDHVPARICYGDVSLAGECKIEIAVIATKC